MDFPGARRGHAVDGISRTKRDRRPDYPIFHADETGLTADWVLHIVTARGDQFPTAPDHPHLLARGRLARRRASFSVAAARRLFGCGGAPAFRLRRRASFSVAGARRLFGCGGAPAFRLRRRAGFSIAATRQLFGCGGAPAFRSRRRAGFSVALAFRLWRRARLGFADRSAWVDGASDPELGRCPRHAAFLPGRSALSNP